MWVGIGSSTLFGLVTEVRRGETPTAELPLILSRLLYSRVPTQVGGVKALAHLAFGNDTNRVEVGERDASTSLSYDIVSAILSYNGACFLAAIYI